MIEAPQPADPTKRHFYRYDAWNRLVEAVEDTDDDGVEEGGGDDTGKRRIRVRRSGAAASANE